MMSAYFNLANECYVVNSTYKFSSNDMFVNNLSNSPRSPLADRFLHNNSS